MKRIILILAILFFGLASNASENLLNTVVLEGTDDGYNVVLKTDKIPQITKTIKNNNEICLNVKGIDASSSVNAIYRGTNDVNSLVIETVGKNELNVYIQAKDISKSIIMAQVDEQEPVILSESFAYGKMLWAIAVLGILALLIKSAKSLTDYENSIVIRKDIKSREIELYKNFQKELDSMPKINNKIKNAYATNIMPRSRRNYKELARL